MEHRCKGCNSILLKSYSGSKVKLRAKFIVWDDFNKSTAQVQCGYCKVFNNMNFSIELQPSKYVIKSDKKEKFYIKK